MRAKTKKTFRARITCRLAGSGQVDQGPNALVQSTRVGPGSFGALGFRAGHTVVIVQIRA